VTAVGRLRPTPWLTAASFACVAAVTVAPAAADDPGEIFRAQRDAFLAEGVRLAGGFVFVTVRVPVPPDATGIVRDKSGRKMSKSLGNSPDPIDLIEKFGADGVRMGMLLTSPAGNDVPFDESMCEQGRNFSNKIWNAFRLVQGWKVEDKAIPEVNREAIHWFESHLAATIAEVDDLMGKYRLSEALMTLYKLSWDDFCAWYLEAVKPGFEQAIDRESYERTVGFFEDILRLLHPFTPFITEEIWQGLKNRETRESLMVQTLKSDSSSYDSDFLVKMDLLFEVITQVRGIRQQHGIPAKDPLVLYVAGTEHIHWDKSLEPILRHLAFVSQVHTQESSPSTEAFSFQVKQWTCSIPAGGYVDMNAEMERVKKEMVYLEGFVESVRKKLSNERFVANAKPEVVAIERQKEADSIAKIEAYARQLKEWEKGTNEKS